MTRAELIDEVAAQGPLSHKQADVVVETILESMKGAIAQGDRIEIRGFGVFSLRLRRPTAQEHPPVSATKNPGSGCRRCATGAAR